LHHEGVETDGSEAPAALRVTEPILAS
jgi:hypothetical protein